MSFSNFPTHEGNNQAFPSFQVPGVQGEPQAHADNDQPRTSTTSQYYDQLLQRSNTQTFPSDPSHQWSSMGGGDSSQMEFLNSWGVFGNGTDFFTQPEVNQNNVTTDHGVFVDGSFSAEHPTGGAESASYVYQTDRKDSYDFDQAANDGKTMYRSALNSYSQQSHCIPGATYNLFGSEEVASNPPVLRTSLNAPDSHASTTEPTFQTPPMNIHATHDYAKRSSSTSNVNSKRSYSDVAKNTVPPVNPRKNESPSVGASRRKKSESEANLITKRASGARGRVKKTHGKPRNTFLEPPTINPDSRYGLDTFDNDIKLSGSSESLPQSRTGSISSVGSGILDEHPLLRSVSSVSSRSSSPSPSVSPCSTRINAYDQPATKPKESQRYHPKTGTYLPSEVKDANPPSISQKEKKESKPLSKSKKEGVFFDPTRIFLSKPTKKKETLQDTPKPKKSDIPNNQQKYSDNSQVLNNGKPGNLNKPQSPCYINNDLRDSVKMKNCETKSTGRTKSKAMETSPDASDQGGHRPCKRKEAFKTPTSEGGATSPSKYPHTSEPKRKKQDSSHKESAARSSESVEKLLGKGKKVIYNYDIGHWKTIVFTWMEWISKEVITWLWELLKLVLRLVMLVALVAGHFLVLACYESYKYISNWINQRFGTKEDPKSPSKNLPKHNTFGLKENIALPGTGAEAMKRLLACKGKDPYSILGLKADASNDDIKRYYRRQAVLVHPDKNQQPGAEEAFKILGHAFDLIGELDKRLAYDNQRLEAEQELNAMHEFADLLTKLHEKVQEAANMLYCDNCGGRHRRVAVDRPVYCCRFCYRCQTRHPAKERDVWAETSILGFRWHYYACMEGTIYDITEWARCKIDLFRNMQANSHNVMFHISTGAGGNRQKPNQSQASEADLEDLLNSFLQKNKRGQTNSANPEDFEDGNNAGRTTKGSKKGRRRRKRH